MLLKRLYICVSAIGLIISFVLNGFSQPVAGFSANIVKGCAPLVVQFNNSSTGANWYHWEFGNGNESFDLNPGAIYGSPGIFTVTLTASDGVDTDVVIKTAYISVTSEPKAGFTSDMTKGCAPFTVNFEDASVPGSSTIVDWFWDFGDGGLSTIKNPSYRFDTSGNYTVKLFVWDANGCQNFYFVTNYITTTNPYINFDAPSSVCDIPLTIDFINKSVGAGLSYSWDFGDGATSTLFNPSHTYAQPGHYTVKLAGTDIENCSDTVTKVIETAVFKADFTFTIKTVYCKEDSFVVEFNDSSSIYATDWLWDFGDGDTSYLQKPVKVFNGSNTYQVTLIVSNNEGCKDTVIKNVIYIHPNAAFTPDSTFSCLPPYEVDFINQSIGNTPLNYLWDFGDGNTSSLENPEHTYTYAGTFEDTLIMWDNFGCRDTARSEVIVRKSIAAFSGDTVEGCVPLTVDFSDSLSVDLIVFWEWNFGDPASGANNSSNLKTPSHFYSDTGQYTVSLIIRNEKNCWDTLVKSQYVKVGLKPDSVDFSILPNDTVCYQDTIQFIDNSSFNDTNIKVNWWLWDIYHSVWPKVITVEDTDFVTWQFKEQYAGPGIFSGEDTVRLIAGFNGCTDTITKPIFIYIPIAIEGSLQTPLSCGPPFTIGLYNASLGYTTFLGWKFSNYETGAVIDSGLTDTTFQTITKSGIYYYQLQVRNDTAGADGNGCTASEGRHITVDSIDVSFVSSPLVSCKNENSFVFADSTYTKYGVIDKWLWDFGDGDTLSSGLNPGDSLVSDEFNHNGRTSGTYKNPVHSYTDTGTYIVKMTVNIVIKSMETGSKLCSFTDSDTVNVIGLYANFGSDKLTECEGGTISFYDSSVSTSVVTNWEWDFGDSTTVSTLKNPTHVYSDTGSYSVKLISTDASGCKDTITKDDVISITKPVAYFVTNDTLVCVNEQVVFFNNSSGLNISYEWDFGDGNSDSSIRPTHAYADSGSYTVSLRVIDSNGCDSIYVLNTNIIVKWSPTAGFDVDTTYVACYPLIVNFTDTSSSDAIAWKWDFGDGFTSYLQNPSHIYIAPSLYDVSLAVTNLNGCSDTITSLNLINIGGPYGSFIIDPDSTCIPHMVTFITNVTNTDFVIWDFGDGTITSLMPVDSGDTVIHNYTKPGTMLPKLILKDSGSCTYTIPSINLVYGDDVEVDFTVDDTFLCDFDTLNISNLTTTLFSISKWQWDFGNGDTSTVKEPDPVFDSMGVFTISLIAESVMGCIDSNYLDISVVDQPEIEVTASDTLGCIPFNVLFHADTIGAVLPVTLWAWDLGNNQIRTGNDISYTFRDTGVSPVKLSATYAQGNCIKDTILEIKGLSWAIAEFTYNPTNPSINNAMIHFTNQSVESTHWKWSFGNGDSSSAFNPDYKYLNPGKYVIRLISSNEGMCSDTILKELFIAQTSNIKVPNAFTPNGDGLNDEFRIMSAGILELLAFKIYNRWGELVFQTNDINKGWDGAYKGKKQDVGSYVYYVLARTADSSEPVLQKGSFSLLH